MRTLIKTIGNVEKPVSMMRVENGRLVTDLTNNQIFTIQGTEALVEANKAGTIDWDKVDLIPLYKNCLADYSENAGNDFNNKIIVKVLSEKSIASIKLDNAFLITPIIQDTKLDSEEGVHEIVFAIMIKSNKDFNVRIYTEDQTLLKFNCDKEELITVKHPARKQKKMLKATTYVNLPKNLYVTDDTKHNRVAGKISVDYRDIISKTSFLNYKKVETVTLDKRLKEKVQTKVLKLYLPNKRIFIEK